MNFGKHIYLAGAAVLLIAVAGCDSPFPLAPVSGVVTINGKPLKNGHVGFNPIPKEGEINAGRPSRAKTDANGRFTLKTVDDKPGAVIGEHQVVIKKRAFDSAAAEPLPEKYNDATELRFTVPAGGSDQANFELELN